MWSEECGGAWWDWGFIGIGVKVKESLGNMVIVKEEVGGGMGCGVILPENSFTSTFCTVVEGAFSTLFCDTVQNVASFLRESLSA
jgi:hypothetical protein